MSTPPGNNSDGAAEADVDVEAAGAVLWRPGPAGEIEIALVHRPRYDDWSLPKGKLDKGETEADAAVREIAEETGYRALLANRLGEVRYQVPEGRKLVHYWSARADGGEFVPNSEVDELRWLGVNAADALLSYRRDNDVLDVFRRVGPPPTPLLLVRHAKAGDRVRWSGHDDLRPLSKGGHRQAAALVGWLGLFGPVRVHSAPPVRCVDTVRPLADSLGVPVTIEPLLGEHGYWDDQEAGLARFLELAVEPGVAAVCSQGGVIPDLVERLTGELEAPSRKASTWVLGFGADRVVSADYYPTP